MATINSKFGFRWDIKGAELDHMPPSPMLTGPPITKKFPLEDGDELLVYRRVSAVGMQDNSEFQFTFAIAFGDGQIFDGEPVVPTLQQLIDFTERVVEIFARHIF